jgi:hypothetical protein
MAQEFEKKLSNHYMIPNITPIPDEIDPKLPRLIFASHHGFSQISISQISATMGVQFSPEWQTSIENRNEYVKERAGILLECLGDVDIKALFIGFVVRTEITTNLDDKMALKAASKAVFGDDREVYEFSIKTTTVKDGIFYSLITKEYFREWNIVMTENIPKLNAAAAFRRGLAVTHDFNSRFAYNNSVDCSIDKSLLASIIERGSSVALCEGEALRGKLIDAIAVPTVPKA